MEQFREYEETVAPQGIYTLSLYKGKLRAKPERSRRFPGRNRGEQDSPGGSPVKVAR